jgi:WD40 repeat protein
MIRSINHICRVRYALISEVSRLIYSPTGGVAVSAAWQDLTISKPPSLTISEEYDKAGRSYTSSFRSWIAERRLVRDPVIVRLDFSDGQPPILIGSVDHPVRFIEDHSLNQKSIQFSHRFWAYPFWIVDLAGSGIFTQEFTPEYA